MRLLSSLRPTGALAAALSVALGVSTLAGCASSRPEPDPPRTAARVGLAATMQIPANPYGDSLAADDAPPVAASVKKQTDPYGLQSAPSPDDVTVSRYYYDDQNTYYVDDQPQAGSSGGYDGSYDSSYGDAAQTSVDDHYYGGYASDYYRYDDPAYYPSVYTYYRPYSTYRPSRTLPPCPSWRSITNWWSRG